jgi:thiol-disulfide isomerase/thioredoxin
MKLKVFVKNDCPNCPPAKELAEELQNEGKLEVETYNVDEPEGLAEAQFYTVMATPSLVLCEEDDQEKTSWRGEAPKKEEVYKEAGM